MGKSSKNNRSVHNPKDDIKQNEDHEKKGKKFWTVIGCINVLLSIAVSLFSIFSYFRPIDVPEDMVVGQEVKDTQKSNPEQPKDGESVEIEEEHTTSEDDFSPIGTKTSFEEDNSAALTAYYGALDDMERNTKEAYKNAESILTKIIEWEYCPRKLKAAAFYNRGLSRCALENRTSALSDFEHSRELVDSPQANFAIGNLYSNIYNEYENALPYYEKAIELSPLPEYQNALDNANDALTREPENAVGGETIAA